MAVCLQREKRSNNNMTTHLSNTTLLEEVPMEILEENEEMVKEITVYKTYNRHLFDDVEEEWEAVMVQSPW